MPEHDPTRTDRLALYMRANAARQAARDDAVRIVDRWNGALTTGRAALWSPTIRCAVLADTPWLNVYCPAARPAERSISGRWTVIRSRRSVAWCLACGALGVAAPIP